MNVTVRSCNCVKDWLQFLSSLICGTLRIAVDSPMSRTRCLSASLKTNCKQSWQYPTVLTALVVPSCKLALKKILSQHTGA
eukprot:2615762-Pleurochrysis_carterae.AAC.6